MIRFSWYQGSKMHFIDAFNDIIRQTTKERYIEPFVGSGAVLFNLEREFDEYIINDLNEHVVSMYSAVKELPYSDYCDILKEVADVFGCIKTNKEAYYNFRNWYNEEYHFTELKEKGLYLHLLTNSCINSMLRFGPNGMNQSFGKRLYTLDEESYNVIQRVLNKTKIMTVDYKEVLLEDSLIFLDPPYFERPTSYTSNFDKNDLIEFLDVIKSLNAEIVYTDIYSTETHKYLNWDYINTKVIRNTAPGKHAGNRQEVAYYNFERKDNEDW